MSGAPVTELPVEKREFVCPVEYCGARFSRNHNLKTHLLSQHAELKPRKTFAANFVRLPSQTDFKAFMCPHPGCGRSYSMKNNCSSHYNRTHVPGYKPKPINNRASRGERLHAIEARALRKSSGHSPEPPVQPHQGKKRIRSEKSVSDSSDSSYNEDDSVEPRSIVDEASPKPLLPSLNLPNLTLLKPIVTLPGLLQSDALNTGARLKTGAAQVLTSIGDPSATPAQGHPSSLLLPSLPSLIPWALPSSSFPYRAPSFDTIPQPGLIPATHGYPNNMPSPFTSSIFSTSSIPSAISTSSAPNSFHLFAAPTLRPQYLTAQTPLPQHPPQ